MIIQELLTGAIAHQVCSSSVFLVELLCWAFSSQPTFFYFSDFLIFRTPKNQSLASHLYPASPVMPLSFSSAIASTRGLARASARPSLVFTGFSRHQLRSYASPAPRSSSTTSTKSDFKILPILVLIGIGSGSYVLMVKSRSPKSLDQTKKE
jgi:hypothetical protein